MAAASVRIIRYAVYTRQSADPSDDLGSCEVQFNTCRDTAQATGEPNLHWIGERFDDEGQSGATLDRPAMQRLRKVIDLGGIDRLFTVALDRLSRRMRDAVTLLDELDRAGVELRLVYQPDVTAGSERRFLRHILAAFAEFERDIIRSRVSDAHAHLRANGRRLAGRAPYGYDADPVTKQLVPNETEAERVRLMFQWAADGKFPREIAEHFNRQGWPTKIYRSRRSGRTSGGGKWTARTVLEVLRNPVHIGRFADGDGTRLGCHEPTVSEEQFDRVGEILDSRRTSPKKARVRHRFPLRQKIICPRCGRKLTTHTMTRKRSNLAGIGYSYYRCGSSAGGRRPCKGVQYRAYDIERAVRQALCDESTWRELLGAAASPEDIRAASATMRALPSPWLDTMMCSCPHLWSTG